MALIVATIVVSRYEEKGEPRWQAELFPGGNITEDAPRRAESSIGPRDAAIGVAEMLKDAHETEELGGLYY